MQIPTLTLVPNPNNVLSCYAVWTTSRPTRSRVEFGEGGFQYAVSDPQEVTEHRLLVFGMKAGRSYTLRAGDGVQWSDAEEFVTGALPAPVNPGNVTLSVPEKIYPGWTLTNNFNQQLDYPPTAVVYDQLGEVVWYYVHEGYPDDQGSVDTSLTSQGNVLVGPSGLSTAVEVDWSGSIQWEGPPQPTSGTGQASHHFQQISNGDYVTLVRVSEDGRNGDEIQQIDPLWSVIWEWNPFEHLVAEGDADWTHNNSVTVDLEQDVVYLSSRNLSQIFKIDRVDGSILWTFGKGGDFAKDPLYTDKKAWPIFQHDPEIQPGGSLLIYDNGNATNNIRPYTRVIEYRLDEDTMQAEVIWEWPGTFDVPEYYTTDFYSPVGGGADRLPNGNTLITVAMRTSEGQPSRLVEVTPAGEVVWEVLLPMTDVYVVGAYRSERIPVMVETLDGM